MLVYVLPQREIVQKYEAIKNKSYDRQTDRQRGKGCGRGRGRGNLLTLLLLILPGNRSASQVCKNALNNTRDFENLRHAQNSKLPNRKRKRNRNRKLKTQKNENEKKNENKNTTQRRSQRCHLREEVKAATLAEGGGSATPVCMTRMRSLLCFVFFFLFPFFF